MRVLGFPLYHHDHATGCSWCKFYHLLIGFMKWYWFTMQIELIWTIKCCCLWTFKFWYIWDGSECQNFWNSEGVRILKNKIALLVSGGCRPPQIPISINRMPKMIGELLSAVEENEKLSTGITWFPLVQDLTDWDTGIARISEIN